MEGMHRWLHIEIPLSGDACFVRLAGGRQVDSMVWSVHSATRNSVLWLCTDMPELRVAPCSAMPCCVMLGCSACFAAGPECCAACGPSSTSHAGAIHNHLQGVVSAQTAAVCFPGTLCRLQTIAHGVPPEPSLCA